MWESILILHEICNLETFHPSYCSWKLPLKYVVQGSCIGDDKLPWASLCGNTHFSWNFLISIFKKSSDRLSACCGTTDCANFLSFHLGKKTWTKLYWCTWRKNYEWIIEWFQNVEIKTSRTCAFSTLDFCFRLYFKWNTIFEDYSFCNILECWVVCCVDRPDYHVRSLISSELECVQWLHLTKSISAMMFWHLSISTSLPWPCS